MVYGEERGCGVSFCVDAVQFLLCTTANNAPPLKPRKSTLIPATDPSGVALSVNVPACHAGDQELGSNHSWYTKENEPSLARP